MKIPKPTTDVIDRFTRIFCWHEYQIFKEFYVNWNREILLNRTELEVEEGRIILSFYVDKLLYKGVINHKSVDLLTYYMVDFDSKTAMFYGFDISGALYVLNGDNAYPVSLWIFRDARDNTPFLAIGNSNGLIVLPHRTKEKLLKHEKKAPIMTLYNMDKDGSTKLDINRKIIDAWARELGIIVR